APGPRPGGRMSERTARTPFHFFGCWELREMLGRRAYDERELLEQLEEVPLDSIYFHTHSCFLHERSFLGGYPNDFATWVAIQVLESRGRKGRRRNDFAAWIDEQLGLPELATAVARTNPFPFGLEKARRRLVALCDETLRRTP